MIFSTIEALSDDRERWFAQTSLYTTHFNSKPEHNNDQQFIGLEYSLRERPQWLAGGATFRNSWDQRSAYAYIGRRFELPVQFLYGKLTGGLLYGWKDEHQDNIPFNQLGVAPAIIPSLGVRGGRVAGELTVFGLGGAMITFGMHF